ncbi:unnamed protein product [Didymodactylos carnosus]|uniref:Uncharacterized protein n=1 Tax=Didymodactylos carnosus TaxID=1234261 RepID=A0A8S2S9A3_9BILA|nr:unnamed protein product [Didymodactylos carnosus]CAF4189037.1 unnamed protein product [Didymodactylos carnosus]CAF4290264.1 unnamed protein product [Didymodactylos carnosus]
MCANMNGERCKTETLIDGLQRVTCCCKNNYCNNLILQPSTCLICTDKDTTQCSNPVTTNCTNTTQPGEQQCGEVKYGISAPTERCYSARVRREWNVFLDPVQRGIVSASVCDGCNNESVLDLTIQKCCCNGYLCNKD